MHFSGKNEEFGGIKSPPLPPPQKKSLKCSDNAYRGVDKLPTLTIFLKLFFHGLTTRLPISRFFGKYSEMKC